MLSKTTVAFQDLVNYRKADDGMWKAEFHGALDIATEGPSSNSAGVERSTSST